MPTAELQLQAGREVYASLATGLENLSLELQPDSPANDEPEQETSQARQLEVAQPQQ
jgi:hypothetical protein